MDSGDAVEHVDGEVDGDVGEAGSVGLVRELRGWEVLIGIVGLAAAMGMGVLLAVLRPDGMVYAWFGTLLFYGLVMGWQLFWPICRGVRVGWVSGKGWLREFGCGVLGVLSAWIALLLFEAVWPADELAPHGDWQPFVESGSLLMACTVGLIAVTIGPVAEEVFFRGLVQRYLHGRFGVIVALVAGSVLFSLYHHPGLRYGAQLVVMGLMLGGLYAWRGNLIGPIVAHVLNNLAGFAVMIVTMIAIANGPALGVNYEQSEFGVMIVAVAPDSPAAEAGIEPGNVVLWVDDVAIEEPDDLVGYLEGLEAGDVIRIGFRSGEDGEEVVVLEVRLGRRGEVFDWQ